MVTGSSLVTFADGVTEINQNRTNLEAKLLISANPENKEKNKKAPAINEDKAKEIGKKAVLDYFKTEINEDFKCYLYLNEYTRNDKAISYWNISWRYNTKKSDIYIDVEINAEDGSILNMSINDYSQYNRAVVPSISLEEAEKISKNFINKINPQNFKECEQDINTNSWSANRYNGSNYDFDYVRKANGIKYYGNSISVTVNGVTGKVISYRCNWDNDLKFPEIKNVIGKDKADEIFNNMLVNNMQYKMFTNKYEYQNAENKKNVKLVFENKFEKGTIIDAKTGNIPKWNENNDNVGIQEKNLNEREKEEFYNEYKEINKAEITMTKEQASSIIEKYVEENYGKEFQIEDLSYDNNEFENEKIWRANFNKIPEEKENEGKKNDKEVEPVLEQRGYISIDASSGQIISLRKYDSYRPYKYEEDEDFEPVLTWDEGYNKAIELLKKYYGDKIINIDLLQKHYVYEENGEEKKSQDKQRYYNFSFTRVENGIPFKNNSIRVSINAKTGQISNMNCYWDYDVEFQSPEKAIKEGKVKEIFDGKYDPELYYIYENVSKDNEKVQMEMKLVYRIRGNKSVYNFNDVEAFTGKMLDYSGEEINDKIEDFLDEIKRSKYEKEIEILAYSGLIDTKGYKLEKEVKYKDLIKTLVDALGYRPYVVDEKAENKSMATMEEVKMDTSYDEDRTTYLSPEEYLKMAKYYGILNEDLENFDVEKPVNRQEMAKAFVKFLDYDKIAECKNIFALSFEDAEKIDDTNIGYAAIAYGLDLIKIENNKFRPNDTATFEEMCIALYDALQNKQEDRNIFYLK
jgi:uncharacterized protein DUF4901/S-layer family protein